MRQYASSRWLRDEAWEHTPGHTLEHTCVFCFTRSAGNTQIQYPLGHSEKIYGPISCCQNCLDDLAELEADIVTDIVIYSSNCANCHRSYSITHEEHNKLIQSGDLGKHNCSQCVIKLRPALIGMERVHRYQCKECSSNFSVDRLITFTSMDLSDLDICQECSKPPSLKIFEYMVKGTTLLEACIYDYNNPKPSVVITEYDTVTQDVFVLFSEAGPRGETIFNALTFIMNRYGDIINTPAKSE